MNSDAFKTPNEIKDYTINWEDTDCGEPVLQSPEEIVVSTWSAYNVNGDTYLNVAADAPSIGDSGTETTVWLGGGTVGQVYSVTNTVTTNNTPARTYERTFTCYINAMNSL